MSQVAFIEERVLFSPDIPAEVNSLLQAAVAASPVDQSRAETLFLQAQALDSHCLQTYFALYKFYFYQKRLVDAERIVLAGLEESAQQGGFPSDYRQLAGNLQQWNLYANECSLFYLYTLKALAFIRLRLGLTLDAQLIFVNLTTARPQGSFGCFCDYRSSSGGD